MMCTSPCHKLSLNKVVLGASKSQQIGASWVVGIAETFSSVFEVCVSVCLCVCASEAGVAKWEWPRAGTKAIPD